MTLNLIRRALMVLTPVALLAGCGSTSQVSLSKPETLFGLLEPGPAARTHLIVVNSLLLSCATACAIRLENPVASDERNSYPCLKHFVTEKRL